MSISKRFLTFIFTATVAFSFFATGESVAQQQYSGLEMAPGHFVGPELPANASKEQRKEWQNKYRPAKKRLKAGTDQVKAVLKQSGGDVKADPEARKFLETVVFPAMTQTDPLTLKRLGEKRQKFLKDFLGKDVTGVARANMIDFTIETLQGYCINSTLHPSARINAVVLISQLTDRPLIPGVQTPLASRRAFGVLLKIFFGENEKQFPEFIKIPAFSGIKNQLEMNAKSGKAVGANTKAQLVAAVMKILPEEADPEKDAIGYWKKRQAVQFAAVLEDAQTLPGLLAILSDDVSSFELKMDVVKTISQTGSMASDAKTNSIVVAAISKFAAKAVDGEAAIITATYEKMIRDGILFGGDDLKQKKESTDFEPTNEDGSGRKPDFGDEPQTPIIELPNYLLNISRNRLRAVAIFCPQAISAASRQGGLEPKAETLANNTVQELGSLLRKSQVGLVDVSQRPRNGGPTPQEKDQARQTSYVDQMIKVCEDSAKTLNSYLEGYAAE